MSQVKLSTLALAVVACFCVAAPVAQAQNAEEKEDKAREISSRSRAASDRAREKAAAKAAKKVPASSAQAAVVAPLYPLATRAVPVGKASVKITPKLQKLTSPEVQANPAQVRLLADEILALPEANAYERAFAAQVAVQATLGKDDNAAIAYAQKALAANGLDNNSHYQLLYLTAQLQFQRQQYAESIATLDRFFTETKSQKPEQLATKANALYRLKRYPEAAALLKQAIAASPAPRADWQQLLMATYHDMGRPADAAQVAQTVATAVPGDKTAQLNLVAIYLQSGQTAKAIELLEQLRGKGQLSTDNEYRQLFAAYANTTGKERQAIAVIEEGLRKGVLKSDFQTQLALAQAYYFSDQPALAVSAYQKAAPLAADGETYLNLAKLLQQEGRIAEAKKAAQQAIARGVKNPESARRILALSGQ